MMALVRGPWLLPAGDNFPSDFLSPGLAQLSFPVSQDQPRQAQVCATEQHQGQDPSGSGENLLPELCWLLSVAAHQLLPTENLAHSFSMWRRHPRDTAPELQISASGEQGLLCNT